MSYEIVYGRQFIKTTRGIIPLLLGGSNNCTMYYGGREIRERSWFVPYGDTWLECPQALLLKKANEELGNQESDNQCLVIGSKWVTCGEFLRYIQNGIKHALPIEEICRLKPGQHLTSELSYYEDVAAPWEHELHTALYTTRELEQWLDVSRLRKSELLASGNVKHVSISLSLQGIQPLCIDRAAISSDLKGPVIAKYKNQYVVGFEEHKLKVNAQIEHAFVFDGIEAAKYVLPVFPDPYCFISAENKVKSANKRYVLRVTEGSRAGLYLLRRYSRSLHFTSDARSAKRFSTEKAALKWFEDYVGTRFSGVKSAESIAISGIASV